MYFAANVLTLTNYGSIDAIVFLINGMIVTSSYKPERRIDISITRIDIPVSTMEITAVIPIAQMDISLGLSL